MQSLEHLGSGTLCDRLSALEMEYKFLDRVRRSLSRCLFIEIENNLGC